MKRRMQRHEFQPSGKAASETLPGFGEFGGNVRGVIIQNVHERKAS